ncbi:hypothetical protein I6F35_05535 [Bradyrhizobium sp. BRP22]|uniref:hypothetical protein n=1 Tax=Bradyrhizobium sp. BRP22 TaxID=2793821 RepID=UPI001CD49827|nr:hypothetical protein [Bradyrhizobium sp. BRP22]MCA1452680.1 hypothetical protein [Bradyrhizobium sp. BRP22]
MIQACAGSAGTTSGKASSRLLGGHSSYLRGRQAIAALFPDKDTNGNAIRYQGDITLFGGSGVTTKFGGDIQLLAPGGQVVLDVEGEVPRARRGWSRKGNIEIYSKGSSLKVNNGGYGIWQTEDATARYAIDNLASLSSYSM